MPGPGGGARGGGGFGGGGFSGGSRGGGGFGGGHHHHHHHHGGFFFFGRRRYYGGGLFGLLIAPFILIILAAIILFASVGSAFSSIANGGRVIYDEQKFRDYAYGEYNAAFGAYDGYEDNIHIVFLTDETNETYCYIAMVGYNIRGEIDSMFGADGTAFGETIKASVNATNHKDTLTRNLSTTVTAMADKVSALGLDSSFIKTENKTKIPESKLINKTELVIAPEYVNDALRYFTEKTGIPVSITVDTMENVFGKTVLTSDIIFVVLALVLIGVAIFLIIRNIRESRRRKVGGNTNRGGRDDNIFDNERFG